MNLQELGLSSDSSGDEEECERVTPSSPQSRADGGDGDISDSKGNDVAGLENVPEPGIKAVEVTSGSGEEKDNITPPSEALQQSRIFAELFGDDEDDNDDEHEENSTRAGGPAAVPSVSAAEPCEKLVFPIKPRPSPGAMLCTARIPSVVGIQTTQFTEGTFDQALEDDQFRLASSIIRWRYKHDPCADDKIARDPEGKPVRESNSSLVKWSDGSMQLLVGSDVYNVAQCPVEKNYVFVRQYNQDSLVCLECHGKVSQKLTFQPGGTDLKAHRRHTLAVRSHTADKAKRTIQWDAPDPADPEVQKQKKAKKQESLLNKALRRQARVARGGRFEGKRPRMSADFMEERDLSPSIRRSRYEYSDSSAEDEELGSSAEDEEYDRSAPSAQPYKHKYGTESESEDEDNEGSTGDASGNEGERSSKVGPRSSSTKKHRRRLLEDSDDDE